MSSKTQILIRFTIILFIDLDFIYTLKLTLFSKKAIKVSKKQTISEICHNLYIVI